MPAQKNIAQKKICPKGHTFFKSSVPIAIGSPTCPVCEQQKKPASGFITKLSAPGRRALESKGISNLKKLSQYTEKDILQLHGMGPSSIPVLKAELNSAGLSFKTVEKKKAGTSLKKKDHGSGPTAKAFIEKLKSYQSDAELKKIQRYFKSGEGEYGQGDQFMGVKMGQLFALAKNFEGMPVEEIEKLLDSPIHEVRAGAISIMDKESRGKKVSPERRKEFFDLYMRRHDRVNNWDLVDLGCLYMTGSYLFDRSRTILYKLAKSKNIWERRTAILSTCYFIRQGDLDDTFRIAEMLVKEKEDLVHKATGWMLRFAGAKDPKRLEAFLDKYAATLPRTLLRYSIEHFDKKKKEYYMNLKKG